MMCKKERIFKSPSQSTRRRKKKKKMIYRIKIVYTLGEKAITIQQSYTTPKNFPSQPQKTVITEVLQVNFKKHSR